MTLVLRSPYASVWNYLGLPARTAVQYFSPRIPGRVTDIYNPRFEVEEVEGLVKLSVEFPGVKAENIEVTAGGNVITVKCKSRSDRAVEKNGYHWREHSESFFSRSVPMPEGADFDKTVARFEDGVLEIRVPVAEKPEAAKIEVHSAGYKGVTGTTAAATAGEASGAPVAEAGPEPETVEITPG